MNQGQKNILFQDRKIRAQSEDGFQPSPKAEPFKRSLAKVAYERIQDIENPELAQQRMNRHKRQESERFKFYDYDGLIARDKANLDLFWLKDDSLDNLDNLPPPDVLQQEIIEHLEAALNSFRDVAAALPRSKVG